MISSLRHACMATDSPRVVWYCQWKNLYSLMSSKNCKHGLKSFRVLRIKSLSISVDICSKFPFVCLDRKSLNVGLCKTYWDVYL